MQLGGLTLGIFGYEAAAAVFPCSGPPGPASLCVSHAACDVRYHDYRGCAMPRVLSLVVLLACLLASASSQTTAKSAKQRGKLVGKSPGKSPSSSVVGKVCRRPVLPRRPRPLLPSLWCTLPRQLRLAMLTWYCAEGSGHVEDRPCQNFHFMQHSGS